MPADLRQTSPLTRHQVLAVSGVDNDPCPVGEWVYLASEVDATLTEIASERDRFAKVIGDHFPQPDIDSVYISEENTRLRAEVAALTRANAELRAASDAFMEGQEASIGGKPRESNPYPPGDSYGVGELWSQWDDGYDCNINRILKAENARLLSDVDGLLNAQLALQAQLETAERDRDAARAAFAPVFIKVDE